MDRFSEDLLIFILALMFDTVSEFRSFDDMFAKNERPANTACQHDLRAWALTVTSELDYLRRRHTQLTLDSGSAHPNAPSPTPSRSC
jgi:hypothetical protein